MPRLIDVWRAVDPEARLIGGDPGDTVVLVRGIGRTRAAPPHLPPPMTGHLLVVDGALLEALPAERLLDEIAASGHEPAALLVALREGQRPPDWPGTAFPSLSSLRPMAALFEGASAYLADEPRHLNSLHAELRLAAAEAALADPTPAAPASLVAQRIRRGVAVVADGEMVALHARPAGRALAARFAAAFSRLFGTPSARAVASRRLREGMWVHEEHIRPGASVWLFDDVPMARTDEIAAEALGVTLRALLRRPAPSARTPASTPADAEPRGRPASATPFADTLLAVARANGRVAPAARSLGVHRNTVLYRLRVVRAQRGIDPRRPEDALRLLREADRSA
jgi:hypothetical protein